MEQQIEHRSHEDKQLETLQAIFFYWKKTLTSYEKLSTDYALIGNHMA